METLNTKKLFSEKNIRLFFDVSLIIKGVLSLFEIIGANIKSALNWSYLGELFNNLTSDSPIKIYAVDISDVEIRDNEEVEEQEERKNFKLLDASRVLQTDESLLLSSYLRLFQHFYVNSLQKEK